MGLVPKSSHGLTQIRPGDYYQMLNASDGDIVTLFKAFGVDVPAKIYTKGDLRRPI